MLLSLDTLSHTKNAEPNIDHLRLSLYKSITFDIPILAVCGKFVTLDLANTAHSSKSLISFRGKHPLKYSEGRMFYSYWKHSEFLPSMHASVFH